MHKIDTVDLEFLHLAASRKGFDEKDIASSNISQISVGRIFDRLASLKDRGLLKNSGNQFLLTEDGTGILWDRSVPVGIRVLRLLKIRPLSESDIVKYLLESGQHVYKEVDELRSAGMIMITTVRHKDVLERVCEITQDGVNLVESGAKDTGLATAQNIISEISNRLQKVNDEQKIKDASERLRDILKDL